jgi:Holliday junction resolvase-like predicted endonuclease
MMNEGWQLIFQRARTSLGEIDLVFEKNNSVNFVEVKTLSDSWRAFQRIEQNQIHKLLQNQIYFSQIYPKKIFKAQICWVLTNELQFVELSE